MTHRSRPLRPLLGLHLLFVLVVLVAAAMFTLACATEDLPSAPAEAPAAADAASSIQTLVEPPEAADVRAARARFNDAIAQGDLETIRDLHAPEYHLITGRSARFHGTDAHLALWEGSFSMDPPDLYVRTPREVRVNAEWGLAEELGDWRGSYTAADGERAQASGIYAAKWQRAAGGQWRLQSEVFTTMACSGSPDGCRPPDPIE